MRVAQGEMWVRVNIKFRRVNIEFRRVNIEFMCALVGVEIMVRYTRRRLVRLVRHKRQKYCYW